MAIQGTLTTMSVPDLLQFLATGAKTGSLKFNRAKIAKEIFFEQGLIVGSFSNDPKEYLGQLLIHYGKIDEARLQLAMEAQRKSGGRLGEILVAKEMLTVAEVHEILRIRTLEIIYDLFLWEEAQFEFFDNQPFPSDLIRVSVQPQSVIMDGIYRIDEWARYRSLVPSDRTILELGAGWTSSLSFGKEVRQILYFVEKKMSVAEICYNMHASAFHVYGQLYELVRDGVARVAGEVPEPVEEPPLPSSPKAAQDEVINLVQSVSDLLWAARAELDDGKPDKALPLIQKILKEEPKNSEAQGLLLLAEGDFLRKIYSNDFSRQAVPKILVDPEKMTMDGIGAQEGFVLSRINGEWDIESILSICPFREADSLRMIKTLLDKGIIGF
ncbi:MAG TPA: DUF4388 domain-containing protein [Pyrinomonadaceae bacterium]|nr:DUF4388 domain-containing protein [Pyrinomonadaceae bacterium]